MTRPSKNIDKLLIKAARERLSDTGWRDLNVRELCKRAEVNLGMFHYYFRTKEEFGRTVLQEFYEEIFSEITHHLDENLTPLDNIERILRTISHFMRQHRKLFLSMMTDVAQGELLVLDFVKRNFPRHLAIIRKLVVEAQRQDLIVDDPVEQIMAFLAGGVLFANIITALLERNSEYFSLMMDVRSSVISDAAIDRRIFFVIRGIKKDRQGS